MTELLQSIYTAKYYIYIIVSNSKVDLSPEGRRPCSGRVCVGWASQLVPAASVAHYAPLDPPEYCPMRLQICMCEVHVFVYSGSSIILYYIECL